MRSYIPFFVSVTLALTRCP